MDEIGDYISACQVGITMASIAIGALGEPAIAHGFESIFGSGHGKDLAVAVSVVIAYVLITFFQSTVGEIVPKLYTIQHAEGLARRIAPVMRIFIIGFKPVIAALNPVKADAIGEESRLTYALTQLRGGDQADQVELNRLRDRLAIIEQGLRP